MHKYPLLSKLLLIGFLMVLLAIPLSLVRDVIAERTANRFNLKTAVEAIETGQKLDCEPVSTVVE